MSSVPQRNEEQDASTGVTDPGSGSSLSLSSKGRTAIAGAMVTASVTLCFFLLFWNRFLGLRSGDGGFSGAVFFLKGILPYRDYYLPVPPLWVVRCAAVLAIFGKLPIVLRGYAVFERVFLSLLLYGWLVRFFRVKDAAWAAIVTMVVSAGDYADPVSSYNHFTIMLAIAGGFTASYALDAGRTKRTLAGNRMCGGSYFAPVPRREANHWAWRDSGNSARSGSLSYQTGGLPEGNEVSSGICRGLVTRGGRLAWLDGALWHPSRISDAGLCYRPRG